MQLLQRHELLFIAVILVLIPNENLLAQPGSASPVVVSRVETSRRSASKTFVGTLVPLKRSTLGSAVDGRVTKMHVEEGDFVTVDTKRMVNGEPLGQELVQLRTVSLDIEIEAALVELHLRRQAENELQQSLPAEIEGAESAVEEIKARLEFSKRNRDRLQGLVGKGVSRQEFDQASSTYDSQMQLNVGLETLLKKLTATRESRLQQARSRVEAQEVEIRRLKELREKYTIRAPFSGYVTAKHTELGQWVARGEPVLEVIHVDIMELVVPVPQAFMQPLQKSLEKSLAEDKKLTATIEVESQNHVVVGEVVASTPQADLRSRSFPVRIQFKNPKTPTGHLLKAGMLARATMFLGDQENDMLFVYKDALFMEMLEELTISLFVVSTNDQGEMVAKKVPVQLGGAIGNWIQVVGDVKQGDQVVVEGNERLQPGKIEVKEVLATEFKPESESPSKSTED